MNNASAKSDAKKAVDDAANSAAADKAKGNTKQLVGGIKQKVGNLIGDEELEAKGLAQRADGKKDEVKGEIKQKIENVKDTVKAGAEVIKDKLTGSRKPT